MSIKYSFLMPYHSRIPQLKSTMLSFVHHYSDRNDFEIVLMEDIKNLDSKVDHEQLVRLAGQFNKFFETRIVTSGSRRCYNPCLLFNEAAQAAKGRFLILTNPECMHKTNVLKGFDEELEKDPLIYVVAACIGATDTVVQPEQPIKGYWYQHSTIRNVMCHFCSVISKYKYMEIGGFDSNYANGVCFEDDDWRNSVMKANIPIICRDDLIVVHQNHPYKSVPRRYLELHNINKRYFLNKFGKDAMTAENLILGEDMRYADQV